nr:MAG TPA: hypothetical protein [Caudoviricetes sp.]
MINHHEFFHHLLDRKLKVSYQESEYMANFTEGDLFELWKVLQSKKHKYPMIWLQTGYKITHDIRGNKTDLKALRFFFITKGSLNDLNKKRFVDTFQSVLYPLLNRFLDELKKTNGVSFGEDKYSFITLPFNDISELSSRERDYGNKKTSQTATTESVWDAIVLEISLRIDNECTHIKKFKIT